MGPNIFDENQLKTAHISIY